MPVLPPADIIGAVVVWGCLLAWWAVLASGASVCVRGLWRDASRDWRRWRGRGFDVLPPPR